MSIPSKNLTWDIDKEIIKTVALTSRMEGSPKGRRDVNYTEKKITCLTEVLGEGAEVILQETLT